MRRQLAVGSEVAHGPHVPTTPDGWLYVQKPLTAFGANYWAGQIAELIELLYSDRGAFL